MDSPARPGRDDIRSAARERLGIDDLKPEQVDAVESALAGEDVLAVMPTGFGKSAIYQIAASLLPGATVVVSPLIALQKDQLEGLDDAPDAPGGVALNSAQSAGTIGAAWDALEHDAASIVLLAPEQLAKDDVLDRLAALEVSLLVVDEAHCVSAWGHDFRPDYLRLAEAADRLGRPPIVALTATGSPPVRQEIVERLRLGPVTVLTAGFDRPNLSLRVQRHTDDAQKRAAVLDDASTLPRPGLVYVATRADTEWYAERLVERGLRAAAYHGALGAKARTSVHERFLDDGLDVVVATSAFGMGIDKPDVRFVVHAAVTESIDGYWQEAGRAGRDGHPAEAILHYRPEDFALRRFFTSRTPDTALLARAYRALVDAEGPLTGRALAPLLDTTTRKASTLLDLLEQAAVARSTGSGTELFERVAPREAASRAAAAVEERERIDRSRIEMMRGYAESPTCRRQLLLGYFGEELPERCGSCDVCGRRGDDADAHGSSEAIRDAAGGSDGGFAPSSTVTHAEWGEGTVMSTEDDRVTVFFEHEGYKVLSLAAVRERGLLDPVG